MKAVWIIYWIILNCTSHVLHISPIKIIRNGKSCSVAINLRKTRILCFSTTFLHEIQTSSITQHIKVSTSCLLNLMFNWFVWSGLDKCYVTIKGGSRCWNSRLMVSCLKSIKTSWQLHLCVELVGTLRCVSSDT